MEENVLGAPEALCHVLIWCSILIRSGDRLLIIEKIKCCLEKKKKSLNFATLVNFTALQAVSSHNSMKSTSVFLSFNLYHFAASFIFIFWCNSYNRFSAKVF